MGQQYHDKYHTKICNNFFFLNFLKLYLSTSFNYLHKWRVKTKTIHVFLFMSQVKIGC